jgi:uncharacterized membrane protein
MNAKKYYLISIIILLLQLFGALWIGHLLPAHAKIPVHWNIKNQIDGYADKTEGVFLLWGINVGLFLMMAFFRKYSPVYQQEREKSNNAIPLLTMGLVFFLALIHIYSLLIALNPGWASNVQVLFLLMGFLFMFIGNVTPKLSRNYFAGIKTPWTFYSDEIWRKTSRLGGFCFFLLGLTFVISGLFNLTGTIMTALMISMFVIVVFVPTIYSFLLYQKAKKDDLKDN